MPGRTEDVTINNKLFRVSQLPAMRGVKLAARIAKIVGPAMGAAVDSGGLAGNVSVEMIARSLFDRLEPEDLEKLLRELFVSTVRVGDTGRAVEVMATFDVDFMGDGLVDLLELVKFSLRVQFGSFGAALQTVGSAIRPKSAEQAPLPPTPLG